MNRQSNWLSQALACSVLAVPASAGTWIVDINNGPGTHFTDLPPAIAAAVPGDVILVRAGNYSSMTLSEGLTIIGTPGAYPTGTQIGCCVLPDNTVNVPAGQIAVLADLRFARDLLIQSAGVVIFDRVEINPYIRVDIVQSSDVRFNRLIGRTTNVSNSRFEIASSSVTGSEPLGSFAVDGETGLTINGQSYGLVTRTSCSGGAGKNIPIGLPGDGGDGGDGIHLSPSGSRLLLAGGGVGTIQGGCGGDSYIGNYGEDAAGLFNDKCGVWRSGCTFLAGTCQGTGAPPVHYVAGPGSFDTPIAPDDPTLELVGTPVQGGSVDFKVYSTPGSVVRLAIGATPIVQPTPNVRVDRLVSQDRNLFVGVVPASGVITQPFMLRAVYTTGSALYAQAQVIDGTAGETRRTNSVPIVVR